MNRQFVLTVCEEDYSRDQSFSESFRKQAYAVVAPLMTRAATQEEDTEHATDIVVRSAKIGMRIRKIEWRNRFLGQVTIRSYRDSGMPTELDKVREGKMDFNFYGFGEEGGPIRNWVLLDMHEFLKTWAADPDVLGKFVLNKDGISGFRPINVCQLPRKCVVDHHEFVLYGPASGWSPSQEARYNFFRLPLETRLRNTCPGCGCRFTDDFNRALALVLGPPKRGQCQKCGWIGTK